jgi:hypothetical protein
MLKCPTLQILVSLNDHCSLCAVINRPVHDNLLRSKNDLPQAGERSNGIMRKIPNITLVWSFCEDRCWAGTKEGVVWLNSWFIDLNVWVKPARDCKMR